MQRIIFLILVCLFLNSSLAIASYGQSSKPREERLEKYRQATGLLHQSYLAKIDSLKKRLSNKIPSYGKGSFYGACPEDTKWAQTIMQKPEVMDEIYAENKSGEKQEEYLAKEIYQLKEGKILFRSGNDIAQYKANPEQGSIIRVSATSKGFRVPATTELTPAGMTLQATSGCIGCHSS
jgi:hypothetical protein